MGKKRKGKSLKKNHVFDEQESPESLNAPHSFVIHRGLPFPNITYLTMDFRRMMEPYTASSLRERRKNKLKDFVSLSGVFHVSHMAIFYRSANRLSLNLARLPQGPTLNFKIHQFTLARDVLASMKKQYFNDTAFKHSPLVSMQRSFQMNSTNTSYPHFLGVPFRSYWTILPAKATTWNWWQTHFKICSRP